MRKCPVSAEEIAMTILGGKTNEDVSTELLAQISGLFNEKNEDMKQKLAAEVCSSSFTFLSSLSFFILFLFCFLSFMYFIFERV